MLVTLLVPVSAIFLGAAILGEQLAPRHFAGLALIACGLMLIDGRLLRYVASRWTGSERRRCVWLEAAAHAKRRAKSLNV